MIGAGISNIASGWDRWFLEWQHPDKQQLISALDVSGNEVPTDLTIPTTPTQTTYRLRDFVKTGDVIRLKLPHIDWQQPGDVKDQFLWLENHQLLSADDHNPDYISCSEDLEWGVYAMVQVGKNQKDENPPFASTDLFGAISTPDTDPNAFASWLYPLTANGNYDYLYYGVDDLPGSCLGSSHIRYDQDAPGIFKNPFTGFSDLFGFADSNGNGEIRGQGDSDQGSYYAVVPYNSATQQFGTPEERSQNRGNSYTSFGIGSANLELDLSTNPAPVPIYTNSQGFGAYGPSAEIDPLVRTFENRFIWLNGLSIAMDYEWNNLLNAYDAIVTVRWDKYDVYDDVRWCGNIRLSPHDFDVSEPSLVVKSYNSILLDKGTSPVHKFAPPLWQEPIATENRFTDETIFEVLPQSYVRIENESEIRVRSGSLFWLKENTKLEIQGNGRLIVEDGAFICVDPTAQIILQDASSEIVMEQGAQIGHNPMMNPTHLQSIQTNGGFSCTLPCEWNVTGNGQLTYAGQTAITSSTIWNTGQYVEDELVIDNNATLTISLSGIVYMEAGAKIIVRPGSKLIVDGGTISSMCDVRWDGIYVSGKSTASQSLNPSLFGKLVLKNDARLENAQQAVNNWGLTAGGSIDWWAIGGIVEADDAIFYNNVHGARFMAYTNIRKGSPIDDESYFRKCDFSIDNNMINGDYLWAFIEEWKTRGVDIFGCNFTNTQTAFEIDRGIGVFNQEAKCIITDYCNSPTYPCPTASQVHSTFTGLRYGVNVSGTGNGLAVTSVYNAVFTNNPWGIYSGSSDDTKVVGCTFDVNGTDGPIGIYLENSPITDIYGNEFNSAGVSPTNIPAGIVAEDLGQTATPIYNNTFNDLAVGCSAQGGNKNGLQGLQFLCNDYNDNLFAISVVNLTPKVGAQGIAAFQGSNGDGAGNRFYNSGLYDYINSAQTEAIVYWHNTATGNPVVPTTSGVFYLVDAGVTVAQDDCNIGSGGKSTLMAEYQEANDQLVVKQAELDAITDNGSTEDALQDVTLAGVGEELQLRNQLLQRSPNVSEEVLKATVEKPAPLPNAMLRDVLAANPQAGKNKQVMDAVDMLPIPMDEYMVEQIAEAAYSISPKEKKAGEVASAHRKREHLAHQVLMELMHDTIKYNPKAAKAFLREKNDLYADLELMKIHASEKNTPGMDEVAERIASRELSESEAARLQGYADYRNLEKELIAEGKNWLQADEQTIAQLWDLSVDENIAGQYAQNILEFMGLAEFEKKLIVPVMQPQGKKADQSNRANTVGYVKVQPVPAREYVVVKYDVRHLGDGVVFELLEATGKPMLSRTLQNTLDETVIDLHGIKAGNYAYRVMSNSKMHYSGKIVVAD